MDGAGAGLSQCGFELGHVDGIRILRTSGNGVAGSLIEGDGIEFVRVVLFLVIVYQISRTVLVGLCGIAGGDSFLVANDKIALSII
ncbi:hypothetical protein [Mitsuokella jalaludinii]|uniref:hypothetical protein n=1 Tax=Mitsuokella jalaludinii TaxID=187979 RepID=UPI001FD10391|nr:hypothetical protein [Mitsuokella jalaludinii]MEE0481561.1 hypothetical protein [Mitsuokella jalaludinii]